MSIFRNTKEIVIGMAEEFGKIIKSKVAFRGIDKERCKKQINSLIDEYTNISNGYANLTSSVDTTKLYGVFQERLSVAKYSPEMRKLYTTFVQNLGGQAKIAEQKNMLSSIGDTSILMRVLLKEVSKDLDKILTSQKDVVTIDKVTVTQATFLGLLENAKEYAKFAAYMLDFTAEVVSKNSIQIPGYRQQFLLKFVQQGATITSQMINRSGMYHFMRDMKNVKTRSADLLVANATTAGFSQIFSIIPQFVYDLIGYALGALNIFRWAPAIYDRYAYERNIRNKELREWMLLKVVAIQHELDNTDKSSVEYANKKKVLQAYDDRITDIDRKIAEYEKEG